MFACQKKKLVLPTENHKMRQINPDRERGVKVKVEELSCDIFLSSIKICA